MNTKDLKIAIIGAGPSGGLLGAHLADKNPEVVIVVVWQSHIDAIKSQGHKIVGFKTFTANFKRENILTDNKDKENINPN